MPPNMSLTCQICGNPIDPKQLCSDDDGKSAHIECYLKQLKQRNEKLNAAQPNLEGPRDTEYKVKSLIKVSSTVQNCTDERSLAELRFLYIIRNPTMLRR